jgi:hypothetical protein
LIPRVWGSLEAPLVANDEIDQLDSAMQLRGRLVNDFILPNGARAGGLEIWFGRDFRIPWEDDPGLGNSEIVLQGDTPLTPSTWPVHLRSNARIAIDPDEGTVTDLAANLTFNAPPWVALSVGYEQLDEQMPLYPFTGPEELVPGGAIDTGTYLPFLEWNAQATFEERRLTKPWTAFRGMTAGIRIVPVEGLTLGFNISLTFDDAEVLQQIYGNRTVVRDTGSIVSWTSPCDCWSAFVVVGTARDRDHLPSVQFGLDLSRLGGGF